MWSGGRTLLLILTASMLLGLMACDGGAASPTVEPARATLPAAPEPTTVVTPSPVRTPSFGPVTFSSDFDDQEQEPVDVGMAFDHGIARLYAYWPYEDVEGGERFRWDFYHDGSHFYGEYGTLEYESGNQWQWIFGTEGKPLEPGIYELVVKVGDRVVLQDSCEVREAPTPTATQAPTQTATQPPAPTQTVAPAPTSTPTSPPEPTATFSPTTEPGPAVGWVEVQNYCGTSMTFTISGQMYTVEANSNLRIELPPGECTYTASLGLGRFGDINRSVIVQAGVVSQLPFSADV